MDSIRKRKLERNHTLVFWVSALFNLGIVTLISTVFYTARGLSPSQIFYTAIVFSIGILLFEIPSSYLADTWGRKRTILLALGFSILCYVIQIFANSLAMFLAAFFANSIAYAMLSGTDEALVYDSNKELGLEENSLKKMGNYFSAKRFFKIFTPIVAVFIAKDISDFQFIILHFIQIAALLTAIFVGLFLTEPKHSESLEEDEAQVFLNAFSLLKKDKEMQIAIVSKSLIFLASFTVWRYYAQYFLDIGLSVLMIGIFSSLWQLASFVFVRNAEKFKNGRPVKNRINFLNRLYLFVSFLILTTVFFAKNIYFIGFIITFAFLFDSIRTPFYSEFFNKKSASFNRATTISLTNFLTNVLSLGVLFIVANLVTFDVKNIFIAATVLVVIVNIFFVFRKKSI